MFNFIVTMEHLGTNTSIFGKNVSVYERLCQILNFNTNFNTNIYETLAPENNQLW